MHISAKSDYAVRAAIELARAADGPTKCLAVANSQGIPPQFLVSILADLRHAGLVQSQRGADGGYWLARDPATISVADVIQAVDGPIALVRGTEAENVVYNDSAAQLQRVWMAVGIKLREVLEHVTLKDLVAGLPDAIADLTDRPVAAVRAVG